MEMQININALKRFGFIFPGQENKLVHKLIFILTLLPFTLLDILVASYFYKDLGNINGAIMFSFYLFASLRAIVRKAYFAYKKDELEVLMKLLNTPVQSKSKFLNRLDADMHLRSTKNIKHFTKLILLYGSYNVSLVGVLSTISVLRRLFFNDIAPPTIANIWWPSDPKEAPSYYVIMVWQMAWNIMYTGIVNSSESFTCSLMLAASERAAMLARAAPRALLPGTRGKVSVLFKEWVKYHQHYLKIVELINKTMGPFILFINLSSFMNIITYNFMFITNPDRSVRIIVILKAIAHLIRAFIMATAGQALVDQSLALSRSVVSVSQVSRGGLKAGPSRSALQVLVTRLSGGAKLEAITGLGYFTVTIEFFCSVLSASISYLIILLQLNKSL